MDEARANRMCAYWYATGRIDEHHTNDDILRIPSGTGAIALDFAETWSEMRGSYRPSVQDAWETYVKELTSCQ